MVGGEVSTGPAPQEKAKAKGGVALPMPEELKQVLMSVWPESDLEALQPRSQRPPTTSVKRIPGKEEQANVQECLCTTMLN